jgi:hypothetical protein
MHSHQKRAHARQLHAAGLTIAEIAHEMGLSRHTVRDWFRKSMPTDDPQHSGGSAGRCPRCASPATAPSQPQAYSYLLGQYLGDGYLCTSFKVPVLRIACADKYPAIIAETRAACLATLAKNVQLVQHIGCTWVQSYSKHWTCLFPQHGPGTKSSRPIVLEDWQRELVTQFPRPFLRGLIHSDGCRVVNHTTRGGKRYEYSRYHFSNKSEDIKALCGWALDLVGAEWRRNNRMNLSVAKRDSVALLDSFIGPK